MARRQKARPQCLCPHPRGVRGEVEGAYRGDEGRDCRGATTEGFGQRRWAAAGGEAGQAGRKVNSSPTWVSIHWYSCRGFDCNIKAELCHIAQLQN